MWDTIHRGKSCKDMRRLDPHFKLLTTQSSAVKTLNHWSWAMVSRSNLDDIDTTKFALCLVEFSHILSKGYCILIGKYMTSVSASHLSNTQQHHWMPPTATEAFVTQAPPPSRPLPLHHFLKIFPPCLTSLVLGLPCPVSEMWRVFGRLWVLTGCKGGLVHLCWSNSRFRATPTSPCLFPNCASLVSEFPVWLLSHSRIRKSCSSGVRDGKILQPVLASGGRLQREWTCGGGRRLAVQGWEGERGVGGAIAR